MAENERISWRWPSREGLPLSTASDMKIMTLFGGSVEYLAIVLDKALLMYNLESLEENAVHLKYAVVGVLNLKKALYLIDSRGVFYEIIPGHTFDVKPLSRRDSTRETLYVQSFAGGYLRIEKDSKECFMYIHWTESKAEAQMKIPVMETKDINQTSCVITLCKWCNVSAELALRLLPIPEFEEVEIAFISVGNGEIYFLHIPETYRSEMDSKSLQLLIQSGLQSTIGIFCLKDSADDKYSQIALLQSSGMVLTISYESSASELYEMTTYMPCDVHCYAALGNRTLVLSDSKTLWQSIIPMDSNEVVAKHKKFAVKGVRLVAAFADEEQVVILTNRGRFHRIALRHVAEMPVDCEELATEIEHTEARFAELQSKLEARREAEWARSIVARASALRGSLVISAKVREERAQTQGVAQADNEQRTSYNELKDHILDIKLANNSGVIFTAKLWSLQLTFTKQGSGLQEIRSVDLACDFGSQMLKIEQKIQMGDITHLQIECRLISRLEDEDVFFMINTSSLDMDCSYFFKPTEEEGVYDFSCDRKPDAPSLLLKLEEEERSGRRPTETKTLLRKIVYHLQEHVYAVMLPSGLNHRQVWLKLLENCSFTTPSTFVDEMKLKDSENGLLQLRVLVGMRLVRFKLDNACSKLTIKCHDLPTLHSVKDAALKLLATLGSTRLTKEALHRIKMDEERDLVSFRDRHKHLTELEILREWRKNISTLLPV